MNVEVTPLPGIGVRKDFALRSGRRVGVVSHRDDQIELIISHDDDPDACPAEIALTPDEAGAPANLLGGPQLVAQLYSWPGSRRPFRSPAAVGALLLGIAISGSTAENATKLLEPLRDLFAAGFFVVFGFNTDPATIPTTLGWAVVLAVSTTITKIAMAGGAARCQGIGPLGRAPGRGALVARGGFSIVIAGLAVGYAAVDEQLAALATTYVLLMAVIGPVAARVVESVTRRLRGTPRPARAVPA